MYHLRIPLGLLEQGRLATPADSFHVALVGASHFATLPLLAAGLRSGPAVMQVAALVLTLMSTGQLAERAGVSRARWLALRGDGARLARLHAASRSPRTWT